MSGWDKHILDFRVESIVTGAEVHSLIQGVKYVHLIDGAKVPLFERLYKHSPGHALQFLKAHARDYWKEVDTVK